MQQNVSVGLGRLGKVWNLEFLLPPLLGTALAVFSVYAARSTLGLLSGVALAGLLIVPVFLYVRVGLVKPLLMLWGVVLPTYARIIFGVPQEHVGGAEVVPLVSLHVLVGLPLVLVAFQQPRISQRLNVVWLLVTLYIGANLLSTFQSFNVAASIFEIVRLVEAVAIGWAISRLAMQPDYREALLFGIVAGTLVQAGLGIVQYALGGTLGLSFLGEPITSRGLEGYDNGVSGTLGHPGPFALYMVMSSPFCLYLATTHDRLGKMVGYLGYLAAVAGIILSASRTGMALVGLTILPVSFIMIRTARRAEKFLFWSTLMLGAVAVSFSFWDEIVVRFTTNIVESLGPRFFMNDMALALARQRPILGYGPNNYIDVVRYTFPYLYDAWEYDNPVHQVYLLYLVELGILGLGAFLSVAGAAVWRTVRTIRQKQNPGLGLAILGSLTTLLLYHFTGWGGIHNQAFFFFWTVVGLSQAYVQSTCRGDST